VVTPDIRDAERLQGFPSGWTDVSVQAAPVRIGHRWKLIGNAVSVPVARWLGKRLLAPGRAGQQAGRSVGSWDGNVWPDAAWGEKRRVYSVKISEFPVLDNYIGLDNFLQYPTRPLSAKASAGFLNRARSGRLRFVDGFLESVDKHLQSQIRVEKIRAN
jgi:DNA (cytosine-5)-methyltransferase 1